MTFIKIVAVVGQFKGIILHELQHNPTTITLLFETHSMGFIFAMIFIKIQRLSVRLEAKSMRLIVPRLSTKHGLSICEKFK